METIYGLSKTLPYGNGGNEERPERIVLRTPTMKMKGTSQGMIGAGAQKLEQQPKMRARMREKARA